MFLKKVYVLALSCLFLNICFSQVYTYKNLEFYFKGLKTDSIKSRTDLIFDIEIKAKEKDSYFYSNLEYGPNNVYGNFYYEIFQFNGIQSKWINITDSVRPLGLHFFDQNGKYDAKFDLKKTRFKHAGEVRKYQIRIFDVASDLLQGEYFVKIYLRVDTILGRDLNGKITLSNIFYLASKENIFFIIEDDK